MKTMLCLLNILVITIKQNFKFLCRIQLMPWTLRNLLFQEEFANAFACVLTLATKSLINIEVIQETDELQNNNDINIILPLE